VLCFSPWCAYLPLNRRILNNYLRLLNYHSLLAS
jgi:hypothetical protein